MTTMTLRVDRVCPNPNQPRTHFEPVALQELADSIKQNGLLQPITVRCLVPGDRYLIVAGERRWRAHQLAGIDTIEANVHDNMTDDQLAVNAIVENLQRVDITALEEALAFQRMLDAGYTPETLAHRLGMKQPHRVRDRVQLLRLAPDLLQLLERRTLTPSQAFELSRLGAGGQQALFRMIRDGRCETYNKLRAAADGLLEAEQQIGMFDLPPPPTDEEQAALTRFERLVERLVDVCRDGMRDNEIVVLKKINPGRAGTIVQQFGLIRSQLAMMERALQMSAAQAALT